LSPTVEYILCGAFDFWKVPPSESHFLEAGFFMYRGMEWSSSSPAHYVGVKCQMSPFHQTVLGHNGQGGEAIS